METLTSQSNISGAETSWKSIDCSSLAALVSSSDQHKHLVIDCRSLFDYNASHITNALNIPCSKLLRRRLQHNSANIMELLSRHNSDLDDLDSDVIVTVYDQSTATPATLSSESFLVVLLDRLANNFKHVSVLTGGFSEFHQSYSDLCVSSSSSSCSSSSSISCFQPHPMHHSSLSQPCMPVCNVGPTRILPFLFLGSQLDALSHETIAQNGITYVINVSVSGPKPSYISESNFLRIPINDNYSEKLTPYFSQAFQFLDKVREANGCVLIHCLAGISRSPTLAIAYVMKVLDFNTDEAYRYVKDKRPTISPNFNFLGQLLEFEQSSLNASTRCSGRSDNSTASSHIDSSFPAKKQRMAVNNGRNSLNFKLAAPSSAASSNNICSPTTALSLLNFSQLSPLREHQTPPSDPVVSGPQLTGSSTDCDDVRPGNAEVVIRLGSKHCAVKRPLVLSSTSGVSAGGSESFNSKSSLPRPQSIFLSAKTDSVSVVSPVMSSPVVPNNLLVAAAGTSPSSTTDLSTSPPSRTFRNINHEEPMAASCWSLTLPCSSGVNLRDLPRVTGGDLYSLPCPSGGDIPVYRCHEASTVESHVGVSASSSHSSLLMDSPEVIRVS